MRSASVPLHRKCRAQGSGTLSSMALLRNLFRSSRESVYTAVNLSFLSLGLNHLGYRRPPAREPCRTSSFSMSRRSCTNVPSSCSSEQAKETAHPKWLSWTSRRSVNVASGGKKRGASEVRFKYLTAIEPCNFKDQSSYWSAAVLPRTMSTFQEVSAASLHSSGSPPLRC